MVASGGGGAFALVHAKSAGRLLAPLIVIAALLLARFVLLATVLPAPNSGGLALTPALKLAFGA